jgi:ribosomal protein S6--L-glutamate ligase
MKIAIISSNTKSPSTQRVKAVAIERGHKAKVLDPLRFTMYVDEVTPRLFYRAKALGRFDAVIPRIGAEVTFYGTAVIRQFERMGVFCLNTSQSITSSRDKFRALQVLSQHRIAIAPTAYVRDPEAIPFAIEQVGGAPLIIKVLEGTQGVGVILAETAKAARAILETLQKAQQNVLVQRFLQESEGHDIRALVVGGRVVAAMRRHAQAGEFRANVHRGGLAEAISLPSEHERIAVASAEILGLQVAGVDLIESSAGPLVVEVNSSPGLTGIEQATGTNVAEAIVAHIEARMGFPALDLTARLGLNSGYGIVDIEVRTDLAGKPIRESPLHELAVKVLSLKRESARIPNPPDTMPLLAGDLLTCYGSYESLRQLMPAGLPARARIRRRLVQA